MTLRVEKVFIIILCTYSSFCFGTDVCEEGNQRTLGYPPNSRVDQMTMMRQSVHKWQ